MTIRMVGLNINDELQEKSESVFSHLESRVIDSDGKRWIRCEFCGLKAPEDEFVSYKLNTNIGRCRKCDAISPPIIILLFELKLYIYVKHYFFLH